MKKDRRNFMRHAGLAGLSIAGAALLPSCNESKDPETFPEPQIGETDTRNWPIDPEWQKTKYGNWGANIPSSEGGLMDAVLLENHAPK